MRMITVKAFNRPAYLKQCLDSLAIQPEIHNYEVLISIDGGPEQVYVSEIIDRLGWRDRARVVEQRNNLGCAGHTRWLLEQGFKESDMVIHIEDDAVMGRDCINWLEWAHAHCEENNYFAACSFLRAHDTFLPKEDNEFGERVASLDPAANFLRPWFETGGPFMFTKKAWEGIVENGGVYGATGNCNAKIWGKDWKRMAIKVTDKGSWGWAINKHLRGDGICVFPDVSRSQNIGADKGIFNPDPTWHMNNIYNKHWIDSDEFQDIIPRALTYKIPTTTVSDSHSL